jgi:GLPGLI family protein
MKTFGCIIFIICLCTDVAFSQIREGKIVYERKTNLYKKYRDQRTRDWIKESDRIKIDVFELYFNDSMSVFRPQESELKESYSWTTFKNIVYQDFKNNERYTIKTIWGEPIHMKDTLWSRRWKITDSKRMINGYNCRKAMWAANDSTRIYAWYTDEIIASTGPESFFGLPGTILGLATEDGGIIYFAKSIEAVTVPKSMFNVPVTKQKIYSADELKTKLKKDFGKNEWGKQMIENVFGFY